MDFAPNDVDLSILLSFPRSGSNFLQNVIKSNAPGIHCTSAYANGIFRRPKACLKSHATTRATLDGELTETWGRTVSASKYIALIRDPRDVMISYCDFLRRAFGDEVTPNTFFDFDVRWSHTELVSRSKGGQPTRHSERPNADGPVYSAIDGLTEWVATWVATGNDTPLLIKYEDLIEAPDETFNVIFDHLGLKPQAQYQDLHTLVSQHGDADRPRARAYGWKTATPIYTSLITQTERKLAPIITALGYDTVGANLSRI